MAISLSQMFRVTPGNIRAYARHAQIAIRARGKHKRYARLGDTYEVIYKVKCTKEWRNVTVRFLKKKPTDPLPQPTLSGPAWVRCTCPWFLYTCEYALAQKGSAWVHYSNGEPANQTNPKNIPFVCKHIYALKDRIAQEPTTPVREPKNKTLPKDTLKNLLDKNKGPKSLPGVPEKPTEEEPPKLTPAEERAKEKAHEEVEQLIDQTQQQEAPKSIVDKVKKTLEEVVTRIDESEGPIADAAAREVTKLVKDLKQKGTEALSDTKIVRKLTELIRRFRGF